MGYRTKPKAEIHGIRVSTIKKLIKRPFNTYAACEATGLEDPEISIFLRKLEQDQILDYIGIDQTGFEKWRAGQQGERILSVKIAAPKPVAEALQALNLVMDKAFEIAQDTQASYLPTQIWLFGSTLRGGDKDGLVGDLDIAVAYEPRLAGDDQRSLQDLECPNEGSYHALFRCRYNLISKLKSVSRLVSPIDLDEAQTIDAQRQIVWKYDRSTGIEDRTKGPIIGTSTSSPGKPSRRSKNYKNPPHLYPDRTLPSPHGTVSHIDEILHCARLARNLWFRGKTIQDVMSLTGCNASAASALLQWSQPSNLQACYDEVAKIAEPVIEFTLPGGSIDVGILEHSKFPLIFVTDTVRMPCNHLAKGLKIKAEQVAPFMRLAAALARDLPRKWRSSTNSQQTFRMGADAIKNGPNIKIPIQKISSQIESFLSASLKEDQETDPLYVEYIYSRTDNRSTIQGTTNNGLGDFIAEFRFGPKVIFQKEIATPSALEELPDGIVCISIKQFSRRASEEDD